MKEIQQIARKEITTASWMLSSLSYYSLCQSQFFLAHNPQSYTTLFYAKTSRYTLLLIMQQTAQKSKMAPSNQLRYEGADSPSKRAPYLSLHPPTHTLSHSHTQPHNRINTSPTMGFQIPFINLFQLLTIFTHVVI